MTAAVAALALSGCTAMDEPAEAQTVASPQRLALDEAAPAMLAQNNVPSLAVGWIEDGEVAWTAVYGERAPGEPAGDSTLYNIASLTKPLVAETILRLVASGTLDLDTPLATHFVDRDLLVRRVRAQAVGARQIDDLDPCPVGKCDSPR